MTQFVRSFNRTGALKQQRLLSVSNAFAAFDLRVLCETAAAAAAAVVIGVVLIYCTLKKLFFPASNRCCKVA